MLGSGLHSKTGAEIGDRDRLPVAVGAQLCPVDDGGRLGENEDTVGAIMTGYGVTSYGVTSYGRTRYNGTRYGRARYGRTRYDGTRYDGTRHGGTKVRHDRIQIDIVTELMD